MMGRHGADLQFQGGRGGRNILREQQRKTESEHDRSSMTEGHPVPKEEPEAHENGIVTPAANESQEHKRRQGRGSDAAKEGATQEVCLLACPPQK
jgi:hypothetical protein